MPNVQSSKLNGQWSMVNAQCPMPPRIALIGSNSLMMIGLREMLEDVMPFAQFSIFSSTTAMLDANSNIGFFHYFVSMSEFTANQDFYLPRTHQTIVLVDCQRSMVNAASAANPNLFSKGSMLNMLCPREDILRQLLTLQQNAHNHYAHYPAPVAQHMQHAAQNEEQLLTHREKEVLAHLAKGMINKEIADALCISLNTVITHRKHIMQKLHSQSLSKLAIYAVQHGYVQPEDIK
ncbi:MAG: response regulator transcription factor [Bacteroidaceae bacterium]|nr:response regulator transcription factor [Bacteroidaceae bacterium]